MSFAKSIWDAAVTLPEDSLPSQATGYDDEVIKRYDTLWHRYVLDGIKKTAPNTLTVDWHHPMFIQASRMTIFYLARDLLSSNPGKYTALSNVLFVYSLLPLWDPETTAFGFIPEAHLPSPYVINRRKEACKSLSKGIGSLLVSNDINRQFILAKIAWQLGFAFNKYSILWKDHPAALESSSTDCTCEASFSVLHYKILAQNQFHPALISNLVHVSVLG
jgi:hypothetical protein